MVPYMLEPKFSNFAIPKTDTGMPTYDNKSKLLMNTKKTVLRDLQNENTNTMLTCMESPVFLKKNGPELEPVKVSTSKRSEPELVEKQSKSTNAVNGHLVYVRRKLEAESRNSIFRRGNDSLCSQPRNVGDQHQTVEEKLQTKKPPICDPQIAPMPTCPVTCVPSVKTSVPSILGKSLDNLEEMSYNNCAVSLSIITPSDYPQRMKIQHWEERYCRLQEFLEMLDQSNQENYMQMLRSLSSEDLSSQAVGLEKRSIQLSLEEARELQRVQQLDVLGKYANNSRPLSTD